MPTISFLQQVEHIFKILHVSTLVGGDGNGLDIFLDGAIDHLLHRAVMAKMNHFGPACLKYPSHDVDGSVMSVEQRGSGHDTDVVLRFINFRRIH